MNPVLATILIIIVWLIPILLYAREAARVDRLWGAQLEAARLLREAALVIDHLNRWEDSLFTQQLTAISTNVAQSAKVLLEARLKLR
jgi:hypothetical protein